MKYVIYAKKEFSTFKQGDVLNTPRSIKSAKKIVDQYPSSRALVCFEDWMKIKRGSNINELIAYCNKFDYTVINEDIETTTKIINKLNMELHGICMLGDNTKEYYFTFDGIDYTLRVKGDKKSLLDSNDVDLVGSRSEVKEAAIESYHTLQAKQD